MHPAPTPKYIHVFNPADCSRGQRILLALVTHEHAELPFVATPHCLGCAHARADAASLDRCLHANAPEVAWDLLGEYVSRR